MTEANHHRFIPRLVSKVPSGLLTAAVVAAILWLTLAPHPLPEEDMPVFPHADKIVHAIMFGGFAWMAGIDIIAHKRRWSNRSEILRIMIFSAVIASIFGGVIELLQEAMGIGRSGDWIDWLADTIGAIIAVPLGVLTVNGCRF